MSEEILAFTELESALHWYMIALAKFQNVCACASCLISFRNAESNLRKVRSSNSA